MTGSSTWVNVVVFLISAAVIWAAGTRLEEYSDEIAQRTGLGEALGGMLLLAVSTSLPEVATTITAIVFLENPTLAVHNLLGGVALQTAILVGADVATRRPGALTFFSPNFGLIIQGVGLIFLLQLVVAGIAARGVPVVFSISVWLVLLAFAYVGVVYLMFNYRNEPPWTPAELDDAQIGEREESGEEESAPVEDRGERSTGGLWLRFALASLLVLVGGWLATQSSEVLADKTGLGSAFLGATLLAGATSLPEVSTTIAASRHGRHATAISNVFGSNAFTVCLVLLAEVLYRGGSVLEHAETSLVFVASLGAAMTCIYLGGLLERKNRTVLGIGWDSAAALVVYAGGMVVLYFMTSGSEAAHPK